MFVSGAVFVLLGGCKVDLAGVGPPPAAAKAAVAAAEPEPLYRALYAGESGEPARQVGQRARMLVWLSDVGFTAEELEALKALAAGARTAQAEAEARAAAARTAEAALLPALQAVADRYAGASPPSEAELGELAAQLDAARAPLVDPREATWKALTAQIAAAEAWVRTLPAQRQDRLADARFFLQHRIGALSTPGAYTDWLGTPWNGSDFGALRVQPPGADEPEMNVGGLWSADELGHGPDARLQGARLAALLVLAFAEPGLVEAIEVKLGQRQVRDYPSGT